MVRAGLSFSESSTLMDSSKLTENSLPVPSKEAGPWRDGAVVSGAVMVTLSVLMSTSKVSTVFPLASLRNESPEYLIVSSLSLYAWVPFFRLIRKVLPSTEISTFASSTFSCPIWISNCVAGSALPSVTSGSSKFKRISVPELLTLLLLYSCGDLLSESGGRAEVSTKRSLKLPA